MNMLHRIRPDVFAVFAGLAGCALAAQASGQVEVSFNADGHYTDAGHGTWERERTEKTLARYLQGLGARLPEGQVLKVTVTDIDLAGWQRLGLNDFRVMRGGTDWPRIALRYELTEQGRTLKAGEENLVDMAYLDRPRRLQNTDLPYEKRMLADWFDSRFAQP